MLNLDTNILIGHLYLGNCALVWLQERTLKFMYLEEIKLRAQNVTTIYVA